MQVTPSRQAPAFAPRTASHSSQAMPDVLVIGGGNAALCAAISAREQGASVLLLEAAPQELRGGNSAHTRNLRCMHDEPTQTLTEAYGEDEYWEDLLRVTGGQTDEALARMAIRGSAEALPWMLRQGVRFQASLTGTLQLSRTNAFFLGGGKALLNTYYRRARELGVRIRYAARVDSLDIERGRFLAADVEVDGRLERLPARSVVLAAGGFESNLKWLEQAWGEAARNFRIRGSAYNQGSVLRQILDAGAVAMGDPSQCHAVAIDARAPRYDGGIVTRVDAVSLGLVVNKLARRFYDEGEDFWPKRYAIWGRLVAREPEQIAYSIIDSKAVGRFIPPVFPPISAPSVRELARLLGLDPQALQATVDGFNASVRPGHFDHTVLDDCRTEGLEPPKSHWAVALDTPPYHAYPLCPGITFTYLGVKVNASAQVQFEHAPPGNVYCAGEMMAGNILGKGYLAGIGMTIGTVFGRIAGSAAAQGALARRDAASEQA